MTEMTDILAGLSPCSSSSPEFSQGGAWGFGPVLCAQWVTHNWALFSEYCDVLTMPTTTFSKIQYT